MSEEVKQLTKFKHLNEWLDIVGHATIGEGCSYNWEVEGVIEDEIKDAITLFLAECDGADRKLIQDGHIWITWDEIKQIAARLKGE